MKRKVNFGIYNKIVSKHLVWARSGWSTLGWDERHLANRQMITWATYRSSTFMMTSMQRFKFNNRAELAGFKFSGLCKTFPPEVFVPLANFVTRNSRIGHALAFIVLRAAKEKLCTACCKEPILTLRLFIKRSFMLSGCVFLWLNPKTFSSSCLFHYACEPNPASCFSAGSWRLEPTLW